MCDNIVMFGPTHSGKSTLMGYLIVYDWEEEKYTQNNLRIKRNIEEMGQKYKSDMALAYYVDTGKDERMTYDKKEISRGGSKRIHIQQTALDIELDCTFIDTPGSDMAWKHKYEGLFLGDVGVFIIEISKLIELSRKMEGSNAYNIMVNQLFSPIYLWKHYKRMKRLIVVISKVDLALYSSYSIKRAESIIRSIDILKDVPIVPISIDVNKRTSNNVISPDHNDMKWYTGKSLIDEIKTMLRNEHEKEEKEPLAWAHIDRLFEKTKSNNQPAIRIKLLNGVIQTGEEIYIGPVKYNKQNVILRGEIFSLKHETRGAVNSLSKGEIGGIIFSRLKVGRERIKLTDIELKRTSMIFGQISNCRRGNLLYFNISKAKLDSKTRAIVDKMNVGERVKLIWFGKIIGMHLLNKMDNDSQYSITLINKSSKDSMFMLPLKENGKFFYDDFVLQFSDSLFIMACLTDIEMISDDLRRKVSVTVEGKINDAALPINSKASYDITYDQVINQTIIFLNNLTDLDLIKVMGNISKFLNQENIRNYKISILPQDKDMDFISSTGLNTYE